MNVRLTLISIMLLASVKCNNDFPFLFKFDEPPKGSTEVKSEDWKDDLCVIVVPVDSTKPDGEKVALINLSKAKEDQVCNHTTYKLEAKKHFRNQGDSCKADDECLYNKCSGDKCAYVPKDGTCTIVNYNNKPIFNKCEDGHYCNEALCKPYIAVGSQCNHDNSCPPGNSCGGVLSAGERKCTADKTIEDNSELLPNSSNRLCKSLLALDFEIEGGKPKRRFCFSKTEIKKEGDKCIEAGFIKIDNEEKEYSNTVNAETVLTKLPAEKQCRTREKFDKWLKEELAASGKTMTYEERKSFLKTLFVDGLQPRYNDANEIVLQFLISASHLMLGAVVLIATLIL